MGNRTRILVTRPLFRLSHELIGKLEAQQKSRLSEWSPDEVELEFGAFLLDPGLGPATYLDRDGRILWDPDMWDVDGTRARAFAAIVVGARKTGIQQLLSLLPTRDPAATDCEACNATGLFQAGRLRDVNGKVVQVICGPCGGLG